MKKRKLIAVEAVESPTVPSKPSPEPVTIGRLLTVLLAWADEELDLDCHKEGDDIPLHVDTIKYSSSGTWLSTLEVSFSSRLGRMNLELDVDDIVEHPERVESKDAWIVLREFHKNHNRHGEGDPPCIAFKNTSQRLRMLSEYVTNMEVQFMQELRRRLGL